MFIVSNLCAILSNTFARVWIEDPAQKDPYLYLQAVVSFFRDSTFNLAHWIFSYKYWIIAIDMECLLEQKTLSKNHMLALRSINYTFIVLDLLMPFIYAVTFSILNAKYENQTTKVSVVAPPPGLVTWYLISNYSRGVLTFVATYFLFDSIRRIRNSIKKVDLDIHMNQGIMVAHLLSLGLYLLATILFYFAFYQVQKHPTSVRANQVGLRVWDIDTICNFVSQAVLCWLFWLLGTPKDNNQSFQSNGQPGLTSTIQDEANSDIIPVRAIQTVTTNFRNSSNSRTESATSENGFPNTSQNTITESSVRKSEVLPQTVEEDSDFNSYGAAGIRLLPQQTAIYDAYQKNDINNRIFTQFIGLKSSQRFQNSFQKVRVSSDL